jgi:hypothetical protein
VWTGSPPPSAPPLSGPTSGVARRAYVVQPSAAIETRRRCLDADSSPGALVTCAAAPGAGEVH